MPKCLPILTSFSDRFLIDFYSQLRPAEPSKSLFFLRKNNVFSKKRLSKLGSIWDAILMPTWLHFAFPNPPKSFKNTTRRGIQILVAFGFDFFSILAPFWEPSWSHVGHLFRAKMPPRRPKMPPGRSLGAKKAPKSDFYRFLRPQEAPRGQFWAHFGWFSAPMFGRFLMDFE